MPRAKTGAKPPTAKPDLRVKDAVLTWRMTETSDIRQDAVVFTAFNLSFGTLTLFYRKTPMRIIAPGLWLDLIVTKVGPPVVEDAAQ